MKSKPAKISSYLEKDDFNNCNWSFSQSKTDLPKKAGSALQEKASYKIGMERAKKNPISSRVRILCQFIQLEPSTSQSMLPKISGSN